MSSWRLRCSARQVELRTVAGIAAVWVADALAASVALPYSFPYQYSDGVIDTAVVVVLLAPVVLAATVLDERPVTAVLTAARRLVVERLLWVSVFLAQASVGALIVIALAPVPAGLVFSDALILAAGVILGFVWLGPSRGWLPVTILVAAASAPGLVPPTVNILYMEALLPTTRWVAAISVGTALACYSTRGAQARAEDEPVW